jgi:hypothetical protein
MHRRHFLQSFSLLVAGALMGIKKAAAGLRNGEQAVKVTGWVSAGGKPVKGALISDGVTLVKTDKRGRYKLTTAPDADFVWVSIPAGYAFPQQKGIASFYQPIGKEVVQVADFELQKLGRDDRKHQFVVWADPQIKTEEDAQLLLSGAAPDTQQLIQSYGNDALFHGIGCGDLVWDKHSLFASYNKAVAITGIPFFQAIGNHDMDYGGDDSQSDRTFKQLYGPTYYSFNRGNAHYVVLDDVYYLGTGRDYKGFITERQMAWLKQDLANVKPGSLVIVSMHIPAYTNMHKRHKKEHPSEGGTTANREELYALLQPFNAHIMSGHTHYNENVIRDNIYEHVHGTVCGAWWTGPVCGDGTPCGYGVYEVDGNDMKWYYKGTGTPRDYQVSIYKMALDGKSTNAIMANVWNYDPAWKVELYADDQLIGNMNQFTGYDPQTITLMKGDKLPVKRPFAEPSLTDHLFLGNVPEGSKIATVKATDRFGSVYTATL